MKSQPFPMPHDIFVGESIQHYMTRKGVRSVPFDVPRMIGSYYATSTVAVVTAMDPWRVQGHMEYQDKGIPPVVGTGFDVKHDGKKFSIGSGSSKHTFYFKNIGFVNKERKEQE